MIYNYIFLRKYMLVLMVICGMWQPSGLLGVEAPSGDQGDWLSSVWKTMNNPYFVMVVGNVVLPVVVSKADDIYTYYWLTDEQREEALKKRDKEKEDHKVFVEMQKTELQLRRDPSWKERILSEALDVERLRQQSLRENEILLARAERENEEREIDHLIKMMQIISSEQKKEMQEMLDVSIQARIKARLEKTKN